MNWFTKELKQVWFSYWNNKTFACDECKGTFSLKNKPFKYLKWIKNCLFKQVKNEFYVVTYLKEMKNSLQVKYRNFFYFNLIRHSVQNC